MTRLGSFCCLVLLQVVPLLVSGQCPAPSGTWLKIGVEKDGVYRITYDMLKAAGFAPDQLDPRQLIMFTAKTGMLPQVNTAPDPNSEVIIHVAGESDGRFDREDAVIFYGQGPDRVEYVDEKGLFAYENNLYSDVNYYMLGIMTCSSGRIQKISGPTGATTTITQYADWSVYERDLHNELKSGRDWVGEIMENKPELTVRFELPGIVPDSPIQVATSLMAQSYSPSSFTVFWNNVTILERPMASIPESQYGAKGAKAADTVITNAATVGASGVPNQDLKIAFTKGSTGRSVGYLDYIAVFVNRKLAWYGNPTFFTIPGNDGISNVDMASAPDDVVIWDISNPQAPTDQTTIAIEDGRRFSASTAMTRTFVAFQMTKLSTPVSVQAVERNTLFTSVPDLLIVSGQQFLAEAERLAAHRRKQYGLDVLVVTPEMIYNEFSSGRPDISAIRNSVRHMYNSAPGKLKNLLLFGRGSYDYKERAFNNTNFVPVYESLNSLNPLETYASDDFYALLEDHEGDWSEVPAVNSTLDIGVGRIPARTIEDAAAVVDKLIAYDTGKDRMGGWRKDILFVADDGDWNIHQGDADELAEDIENDYQRYHTNKIYLDAFEQEERAGGQASPKAAEALSNELSKGYAIVNFTGHGNEYVWMDERVLDQDSPYELPNNPRQPLLVTATCEFGRHDNPLVISTAEALLARKKGGAIGLVTTTRPVHSTTNFSLNKAFYSSLFDVSAGPKDLGTIFKETKNKSLSGISNRNFSLLADPSMRFGLHPETLVTTSISTLNGSDTLKALSEVIVVGEVRAGDELATYFDGTIEIALYDKRATHVTLGDENEPFTFKKWDNLLFRGKATIDNGKFVHAFRLPANLATAIGDGKLAMYAYNRDKTREAFGTTLNVKIGGVETNPGADTSGPGIELFIGDSTFVDGGLANNNTMLIARLDDSNGLNTSGYNPVGLTAQLDGSKTFVVNEYYVADVDDPTQGTVRFPLNGLEPGSHTITFIAHDNFNNSSTSSVTFVVGESNKLEIEEFIGYPNPFTIGQPTSFEFSHNRAGDDLEAQLLIYNSMGKLVDERTYFVPESAYKVTLGEWNGLSSFGSNMSDGIYLARLSVRSLSDGAKNAKIAKLILAN